MFLNGLEESPGQWTGWTLSGIAKCGHHLYLSGGGQNDLSSLTNWNANAAAAIALVQKVNTILGSGSGATSAQATFASNITAGNLIVIALAVNAGTPSSVTDTLGNGYTKAADATSPNRVQIWYCQNAIGGANTVTISGAGAGAFWCVCAMEFSGADLYNPFDQVHTNPAQGSGTAPTSGNVTTGTNGELYVGVVTSGGSSTGTITPEASWNDRLNQTDNNNHVSCDVETFGDTSVVAAGTLAATWTWVNSVSACAAIATFKPAGSSAGTAPTVEAARFKVTAAGQIWNLTDILPVGNFDLRVDWDTTVMGQDLSGSPTSFLGAHLGDNNHVTVAIAEPIATFGVYLERFPANNPTNDTDVGPITPKMTARFGTIRLNRASNVFTAYYYDPNLQSWVAGAGTTLAYSTTLKAVDLWFKNTTSGSKYYFQNVRNLVPTVTSGTATSPVMDTADGLRGLGWFADAGGTGTVLVEYRVAQTSGGVSSAIYQTATNWLPITPSASNRYVQVRLTISGGSTTAPSPEVGPILVNGSLDAATATLLFKREVVSAIRHTSSLNQINFGLTPSQFNAYWSRFGLGLGKWVAANGATLTFEGTTYNLATSYISGIVTTLTDNTNGPGTGNQAVIEAASTALPGLIAGWSVLSSVITGTQKTNITSALNANSGNARNGNGYAIYLAWKQLQTALWNLDGAFVNGRWDSTAAGTPWADSDSASDFTSLSGIYIGQGAFNDSGTDIHIDVYSNAICLDATRVLDAHPGYTNASTFLDWVKQCVRSFNQITGPDGLAAIMGRGLNADVFTDGGQLALDSAVLCGGRYEIAREILGNGLWSALKNCYFFGFDFISATMARGGNVNTIEPQSSVAASTGKQCSTLGCAATTAALYTSAPAANPGESAGAAIWQAAAIAIVQGPNATDPQLQCHGYAYDIDNTGNPGLFGPTRLMAAQFWQNVGTAATYHAFDRHGAGFCYHDSTSGSTDFNSLEVTTTRQAIHAGLGVFVWRQGVPSSWNSSGGATSATNNTLTEVYYLRGHHIVANAKLALKADARTASNFGFAAPPIPLASGDSLNSTATTSAYAYAESPAAYPITLSAIITGLTSNLQGTGVPRTGTAFVTSSLQWNRGKFGGLSVDVTNTADTPTGTIYAAADLALNLAPMTAATETAYVASYNRSTDVVTFTFDNGGVVAAEDVYLAHTAQNLSGQAIGNYSVTGSAVLAFAGKHAAADWFGGSALTSISFSSVLQATLQTAGNLSVYKADGATTYVQADQGDVTLRAACLPSQFNKVYAYDIFDTAVDVTASCTVSSGVSVVIPSAVVTAYKFGIARFAVVRNLGVIPFSAPFGAFYEFIGGLGA